jgi:Cytochrome c peroxidase
VRQFRDAYGGPDVAALLDAIATYERSLVTPGSRFDRWLAGEAAAITPEELSGYQLFKSLGCISCHQGVNVGGNLFQRHGIFHPLGSPEPHWFGSPACVTWRPLRPISTTAARLRCRSGQGNGIAQLDRVLTDQQIAAIVAFLDTLTGTYRSEVVRPATGTPRAATALPMRLLSGALGVLLLLALLTWLLLRGIDTNAPAYAVSLRAFDDFALAEASLHRDVLQARAGLLRDYDTLVKAVEAMQDAVSRLRSHAQTEGLDVGPADRLAATVSQQEELTERFKSSNALLQNSLSYVGLLSTSPPFGAQDAQLAPATGALAAALLYLRRDTSPDAVKALQDRIDQFAAQAPAAGPDAEAAGRCSRIPAYFKSSYLQSMKRCRPWSPHQVGSLSKSSVHSSPTTGRLSRRRRSAFGCCYT